MTHAEKLNRIYVCGAEDKFRDVSELRRADLAFVKLMNKAEQAALPADEHIGSQTKLAIEYFKSSFLVGDIVSVPNDLFTCAQLSAPPPVLMPEISDAHYVATLRLKGVEFTPQGSSFIQVVDPRPESKTKVQIAGKRYSPSVRPTVRPSAVRPSVRPSVRHVRPSVRPSDRPSVRPSVHPSVPSDRPSVRPSDRPTDRPFVRPSVRPTVRPSVRPTDRPTVIDDKFRQHCEAFCHFVTLVVLLSTSSVCSSRTLIRCSFFLFQRRLKVSISWRGLALGSFKELAKRYLC